METAEEAPNVQKGTTVKDPQTDSNEEIFALDFTTSEVLPNLDHIVYADDQDPLVLTDAGLVALYHAKLFERLYVGEVMAAMAYEARRTIEGRVRTLVPGEVSENTSGAIYHDGASSSILIGVAHSPAYSYWRDGSRLYNIAARILLGRAKIRLALNPTDAEALAVLLYTRKTLRRDPETGVPAAR